MGNTQGQGAEVGPRPPLTPFDVTCLVVGAVVGADIYVVASLGAGLMGPAMLVAWAIGGVMAAVIALSFAQCVTIVPKSGGSYAYAREAFGYFPGFLVGWALFLAALVAISVFPVAFVRYLRFFVPDLSWWVDALAKVAFVAFLTATNYLGVRLTGKVNDVLVAAKLGPLFLLVLLGIAFATFSPANAIANVEPFAPLGWDGLVKTIILVFWAYAGFELAVLPAAEVIDASRTLPLAIIRGMAIVTLVYLTVNAIVVLAMPWYLLADTTAPLADAMQTMMRVLSLPFWGIGGAIMALGAILSISGADESATLGTSRLSYAMAADGYFPHFLARLHPKYGTPYLSVIFQGALALTASILGNLTGLIGLSVFLLSLAYVGTILAAWKLVRRVPERRLQFAGSRVVHLLALVSAIYLMTQTDSPVWLLGTLLIAAGLPVYVCFAPRSELIEVQERILSEEHRLAAIERALLVAPAYVLRRIRILLERIDSSHR